MKHIEIAISQIGKQEIPKGSNWGDGSFFMKSIGIEYPKTSGIYKIKNLNNDKVYVGSAVNLDKRIKNHIWQINRRQHRNVHLQDSVLKNGWDSFFFIVLEKCEKEDIISREQFWIDYYKSYDKNFGYNKQPVAFSNKGNKLSEETKKKIGNYFKGKPKTDEQNKKNSLAHIGINNINYRRPISDKLRQAIIESNKRRAKK